MQRQRLTAQCPDLFICHPLERRRRGIRSLDGLDSNSCALLTRGWPLLRAVGSLEADGETHQCSALLARIVPEIKNTISSAFGGARGRHTGALRSGSLLLLGLVECERKAHFTITWDRGAECILIWVGTGQKKCALVVGLFRSLSLLFNSLFPSETALSSAVRTEQETVPVAYGFPLR